MHHQVLVASAERALELQRTGEKRVIVLSDATRRLRMEDFEGWVVITSAEIRRCMTSPNSQDYKAIFPSDHMTAVVINDGVLEVLCDADYTRMARYLEDVPPSQLFIGTTHWMSLMTWLGPLRRPKRLFLRSPPQHGFVWAVRNPIALLDMPGWVDWLFLCAGLMIIKIAVEVACALAMEKIYMS